MLFLPRFRLGKGPERGSVRFLYIILRGKKKHQSYFCHQILLLLTAGSLGLLVKTFAILPDRVNSIYCTFFCYAKKLTYAFFTPPLLQEDTKEMDGAVTDAVAPTANMDEIHKQVCIV